MQPADQHQPDRGNARGEAAGRVVREGALAVAEVGRTCGAGTCCQGCSSTIGRIIRAESHRQANTAAPLVAPLAAVSS